MVINIWIIYSMAVNWPHLQKYLYSSPVWPMFCMSADWSQADPGGFPQALSCFSDMSQAAESCLWHCTRLSDPACVQPMAPDWAYETCGLITSLLFSVTAESSWKFKGSSRTRSQCVPLMTPTRWPVRGCLRWRRTAGAALPSWSNPGPHIKVRTGSGLWGIMAGSKAAERPHLYLSS